MQSDLIRKVSAFTKQKSVRKAWQRIVSGLTCVVVFCTTYALILPAITMEGNAFCGIEDHIHNEDCYTKEDTMRLVCDPVHSHSAACQSEDGTLICGKAEFVVHTHSELCYDSQGTLQCGLPQVTEHSDEAGTFYLIEGSETPVRDAHVHNDGCYTAQRGALLCTLVEGETHVHDAVSCYGPEETVCGQEEWEAHTHGDLCFGETETVCGLEETQGHAHGDGCYSEPVLVCVTEEIAGHTHSETCYGEKPLVCQTAEGEEHSHAEGCYGEAPLVCGLEEVAGHTHGEACYNRELICTAEEVEAHTHGETCYCKPLICTMQEGEGHSHTEECRSTPLVCTISEEAHYHTDACYEMNDVLSCGKLAVQTHIHTESCLQQKAAEELLVCEKQEHTHTLTCYTNAEADVENEQQWTATMAGLDLSGSNAEKMLAVAKSQLGYQESVANYQVQEDGITIKGYNRYGAWAGTPYADWNALFVDFCLHYAGISQQEFPWKTMTKVQTEEPGAGDLIFLSADGESYTGIVTKVSEGYVTAIFGDYKNEVRSETFTVKDQGIVGYALLPEEMEQAAQIAETTEQEVTAQETTEETTAPTETQEVQEDEVLLELERAGKVLMALRDGSINWDTVTNLNGAANIKVSVEQNPDGPDAEYNPGTDTFDVSLRIDFTVATQSVKDSNYLYTYTLPENMIVPSDLIGRTFVGKDTGGSDAFVYSFASYTDADGQTRYRINIQFLESYVSNAGQEINAYIDFDGEAKGDAVNDGTGDLVIDEDVVVSEEEIKYPPSTTHTDSIKTEKSASEYNVQNQTIDYTVKVSSEKGTSNAIQFTDKITSNGIQLGDITGVTIVKHKTDGSSETVSNVTPTVSNSDKTIAAELPALNDGEYYEITYSCKIQQNGWFYEGAVNNTAKATTTTPGGTTLESSASTKTEFTSSPVTKSGAYEAEQGRIKWTIKVSPGYGYGGLAGYVLEDPAFQNMTKEELQESIRPSNGFRIEEDQDGNKKIVFEATENWGYGAVNYNTYTITYYTDAPQSTMPEEQSNTVELTPPWPNFPPNTDTETVTIPMGGSIDKSFVSAADKVINWKIEITIPEGGLAEGTVIKENMQDITSMTYAQLEELNDQLKSILGADGYTLQAKCLDESWNTKDFAQIDPNTTHTFDEIEIRVNKDYQQNTNTFDNGKIVLNVSNTMKDGQQNDGWNYTNTVSMGDKSDSDSYTYHPHVTKMDGNGHAEDTTVTTKDGKISWIVKVFVENDTDKVTVVDTLPAGVTLTQIGYGNADWQAKNDRKPLADAMSTVVIANQNCGVTNSSTTTDDGEQQITTEITAPENGKILGGSTIYLYYDCEMDDLSEGTREYTNHVEVFDNEVYYGQDDQKQTVTVDLPPAIKKTDHNGKTEDTELNTKDGIIRWFVEVYLYDDTESFTVKDELPKGVKLVKFGASDSRYANGSALTDNKLTLDKSIANTACTVNTEFVPATAAQEQYVLTTVTAKDGAKFPAGSTIYLYYECQIEQEVKPGETFTAPYTNKAILNPGSDNPPEASQTQRVTVENSEKVTKLGVDESGKTTDGKIEMEIEINESNNRAVVKWFVITRLKDAADVVTVQDTLPAGVKLSKLGVMLSNAENEWVEGWVAQNATSVGNGNSGTIDTGNQTAEYSITGTGTDLDPYVVTTIIRDKYGKVPGNYSIYAYYECEIISLPELGEEETLTLVNNATVTVDGGNYGSDSQEQEVTIKNPAKRVTKSGVMNAEGSITNRLYYKVVLNEAGEDLVPGVEVLTLTDVMTFAYNPWYNCISSDLVESSVKLYPAVQQVNAEGKTEYVKGAEPIGNWSWEFTSNQNEIHASGQNGNVENIITAKIPDGMPLILEYAYDISVANPNGNTISLSIANTASLEGGKTGEDAVNDGYNWVVSGTSGGASTDNSYSFTKIERGNFNNLLSGATFTAYRCSDSAAVMTYTTDAFGRFSLSIKDGKTDEESVGCYAYDTLYYVTETSAPAGYVMPDNPEKYYFYFGSNGGQAPSVPDGKTAYDLSKMAASEYVANDKLPSGDIQVVKKWYNADGTTEITGYEKVQSITFDLYQVTSESAPTGNNGSGDLVAEAPTGGTLYQADLTVTKDSGWTTTIQDLPSQGYDQEGELVYYTYYIVEDSSDAFERMGYVNNGGIAEGSITISNKETVPVYELPETGGAGTMMYTWSGMALCGTAALGYLRKKRRKGDNS